MIEVFFVLTILRGLDWKFAGELGETDWVDSRAEGVTIGSQSRPELYTEGGSSSGSSKSWSVLLSFERKSRISGSHVIKS